MGKEPASEVAPVQEVDHKEVSQGLDEASLKQHFEFRDKLLKHLAQAKSQQEIKELRSYDEVLQRQALALLQPAGNGTKNRLAKDDPGFDSDKNEHQCHRQEADGNKMNTATSKVEKGASSSFLARSCRCFALELEHTLPGCVALNVYCLSYMAHYNLCSSLIAYYTRTFVNQDAVYAVVMVLGCVLARITGGIWEYTSEKTQEELEELEEKEKGLFAPMMRIFRKRETLRSALSEAAFSMCCVAVVYFYYYHLIVPFDTRMSIIEGLPSLQEGSNTYISDMLSEKLTGDNLATPQDLEQECLTEVEALYEPLLSTYNASFCSSASSSSVDMTTQDEDYIYYHLSPLSYNMVFGDANAVLVTPAMELLFAFSVVCVTQGLLKRMKLV